MIGDELAAATGGPMTVMDARTRAIDPMRRARNVVAAPTTWLAVAVVATSLVLLTPVRLVLGPMYWDLYQYFDGANRILDGQVPGADFFTPVGPLGYYLFTGLAAVFPEGQPLLLAQWSALLITAPLMAVVTWDVSRRSRALGWVLVVPFLLFALLPFNTVAYYPFPGADGFGIYNRHVCHLLYVLVAALLFVHDRRLRTALAWVSLTALFFLKITGFLAGVGVGLYAVLAGRVRPRDGLVVAFALAGSLVAVEWSSGLVGHYLSDVIALIGINSAILAPRFLQAASLNVGILLPVGALAVLLLWSDRLSPAARVRDVVRTRSRARAAALLDRPAAWLLAVLAVGVFSETQNLGSQALIFLWPVCVRVLRDVRRSGGRDVVTGATVLLVAFAMIPPAATVGDRAARAFAGSAVAVPLPGEHLGTLGAVSTRPEVAARAEDMLRFYPGHRDAYSDLVESRNLPTPLLFSDPDFQATYLLAVDHAVGAIRRLEIEHGVRFDTIWSLNNYNPFPWLLDRSAPRALPIAADPMRTVPTPGSAEQRAVAMTDLVLYPTCPTTLMNADLLDTYAAGLVDHHRIELTECYDAFIEPGTWARLRGPVRR